MLIDSHAHLDDSRLAADLDAVLRRAREAGVVGIVTVGSDVESSARAVTLAERYQGFVYAAVGIHPHDAGLLGEATARELRALARRPGVVAVGETGLDYHYMNASREAQRKAFRFHLRLADEADLPVIVHCRKAFADCFELLSEHRPSGWRGVAHCFSGSEEDARRFLALGFHVSFSGALTFANARRLRQVARSIPLERALVETDCPYLAPRAHRGERNEPAYVRFVAEELAGIAGVAIARVCEVTARNAVALFKLEGIGGDLLTR